MTKRMSLEVRAKKMASADTQVRWLVRAFKLQHWDIGVEWNAGEEDEGTTTVEAQYQRCTLRFNVHEVNTKCVAHEFAHVLMSRLADVALRYAKSVPDSKKEAKKAVEYSEDECATAMECGLVWMLRRAGLR